MRKMPAHIHELKKSSGKVFQETDKSFIKCSGCFVVYKQNYIKCKVIPQIRTKMKLEIHTYTFLLVKKHVTKDPKEKTLY